MLASEKPIWCCTEHVLFLNRKEFQMLSEPLILWLFYVTVGGLLLLAIFRLPERILLFIGRFISPNWMSIIHTPIVWVGYFVLYKNGYLFWGLMTIVVSAALDRLDGRLAAVLDAHAKKPVIVPKDVWQQLNHKGGTPLGKKLDPLMDKLAVIPIYIEVAYQFVTRSELVQDNPRIWLLGFGAFLISLMLLTELVGQVIRMEYFDKYRQKKDSAATWVGKVKAGAQWVFLAFYPIWDQGWITREHWGYLLFLNLLLTGILALAIMSVVSKFIKFKDRWTKLFSHKTKGAEKTRA